MKVSALWLTTHKITQLFGLQGYSINQQKPIPVSTLKRVYSIILLILLSYFTIWSCVGKFNTMPILNDTLNIYFQSFRTVINTVAIFTQITTMNILCPSQMSIVVTTLHQVNAKLNPGQDFHVRKIDILKILFFHVVVVGLLAFETITWKINFELHVSKFFIFDSFCKYLIGLNILQFVNYLVVFETLFSCITRKVQKLMDQSHDTVMGHFGEMVVPLTVTELSCLHELLCEAVDQLCTSYGFFMLFYQMVVVTEMVAICYFIILVLTATLLPPKIELVIILLAVWTVCVMVNSVLIAIFGSRTTSAANKVIDVGNKFILDPKREKDPKIELQMTRFINRADYRKFHLSAQGFFNIDLKLVARTLSSVTAYTVVLIQFHSMK